MMRKIGLTCIATILMAVLICGCSGAKSDVSDDATSNTSDTSSASDVSTTDDESSASSKDTSVHVYDDAEYSLDGDTFKYSFGQTDKITTLTIPEGFRLYMVSSYNAVFDDSNGNEITVLNMPEAGPSKDALEHAIKYHEEKEEFTVINDTPIEETINGQSFMYNLYEEKYSKKVTNINLQGYLDYTQHRCFCISAEFNKNDITSDKLVEVITSMISSMKQEQFF